jgi:hypothetical protein
MTAQSGETLFYKGEELRMATEPLNQYLSEKSDIKFVCNFTSCWRGYYGTWEIIDNKLYLIQLEAYIEGYEKVDLNYLFPGQNKVFANWFSGEIRIPQGERLHYVHMGYGTLYEKDLYLVFENGKLVNQYVLDNQAKYKQIKNRLKEEAKMVKEENFFYVFSIILFVIVFVVICFGIYNFMKFDTPTANIISVIIGSGAVLLIGGLISYFFIFKEDEKKQEKIVLFIFIDVLLLVLTGISIGVYYLINLGTILAYIITAVIFCGVGYLIYLAINNLIKKQKLKNLV